MSIEGFLKNLSYNNDYYQKFDHLSKEKYKELETSFKSKKELTDFSKEFGWFTNCSVILIDSYSNTEKTFIAAHKTANYIYKWTTLPKATWKSKIKINPSDTVLFMYNEFGKPTTALSANNFVTEVGYNGYTRDPAKDLIPLEYSQELTLKDINAVYNGYFQYLEIFSSKPFQHNSLKDINFIFYGNSRILDREQISRWATLNGLKPSTNKIVANKQNVLVNLSEFPTTVKSIFQSKIPIDFRYKNLPRISIKEFINIPYNISYKKDFNPSLDIIKATRYNEVNRFKKWVQEYETVQLNKKTRQWLIDELNLIGDSLIVV